MSVLRAAIRAGLAAFFRRGQARAPAAVTSTTPDSLSQRIISCATTVSNTLGTGLAEVVYENALAHELRKAGLRVCQKQTVVVCYDGMIVGDYTADLFVEDTVLIELKAVTDRNAFDAAQCTNYLKATGLTRSVLLNFGNQRLSAQCMANGA
ncbi:GxxExxY protein [Acidisphaera sp. S103]|uniref:GxxExxY protein n=1 Tax=Acidisphaera sp. S103 TaxID=1747223 RepID=UPI00131ADC0B|nr:GxxExxY protein [Acidisphaera sp. S103]